MKDFLAAIGTVMLGFAVGGVIIWLVSRKAWPR